MSQTFFSKQDPTETLSRLNLLGSSGGFVTVWLKGQKDKVRYQVLKFDKDRMEIVLDSKEKVFTPGDTILCSFDLRGMSFFSEVIFQVSISEYVVLQFKNTLFKSERRSSYRLMTYPMYEVWAEFDLGETYQGGKVVNLQNPKKSQTGIFNNFLSLVGDKSASDEKSNLLRVRIQDLSTTGLALHIGDLENPFFQKDKVYKNVNIRFKDEVIVIPELKIVYLVSFISNDKNLKKYKVGIHFEDLPTAIDEQIGKKINVLLRENDFNKDFENFIK